MELVENDGRLWQNFGCCCSEARAHVHGDGLDWLAHGLRQGLDEFAGVLLFVPLADFEHARSGLV
jgi:hypothetical protein